MHAATKDAQNTFNVNANRLFWELLDTVGDQSGSSVGNGDYSGEARVLRYNSPAGKETTIQRFICRITDATNFSSAGYGGISALTNGVKVSIHNAAGTEVRDYTRRTIKTNAEWIGLACDYLAADFGSGDNTYSFHWDIGASGVGATLPPGWSIRVTLNDDFTGLVGHEFAVHGYLLDVG